MNSPRSEHFEAKSHHTTMIEIYCNYLFLVLWHEINKINAKLLNFLYLKLLKNVVTISRAQASEPWAAELHALAVASGSAQFLPGPGLGLSTPIYSDTARKIRKFCPIAALKGLRSVHFQVFRGPLKELANDVSWSTQVPTKGWLLFKQQRSNCSNTHWHPLKSAIMYPEPLWASSNAAVSKTVRSLWRIWIIHTRQIWKLGIHDFWMSEGNDPQAVSSC